MGAQPPIAVFSHLAGRDKLQLALIAILGLPLRLFFGLRNLPGKGNWYNQPLIPVEYLFDPGQYVVLARNLRSHHVFSLAQTGALVPTYYRPPGYPLFLSLFLSDGNLSLTALCLAQAILGTLTAMLVYLIAREKFGWHTGLLAGCLMALAPRSSFWTGELWTETLYTFLLTLALRLFEKQRHAAAGAAYGLSCLVRPITLPFLAFLLAVAFLCPALRGLRRGALTTVAVALLVIAPWTLRNALVFQQFIPVAAAGGKSNLLYGTFAIQPNKGVWEQVLNEPGFRSPFAYDDPRAEQLLFQRAIERIAAAPLRWLVLRAKQYPRLLLDTGWYLHLPHPLLTRLAGYAFIAGQLLFWGLALYGMVLERVSHLSLFPVFILLLHLPLWVEPRYSLPMMPMAAILASVALRQLARRHCG